MLVTSAASHAEPLPRYGVDASEVQSLRVHYPAAADKLEQGESLLLKATAVPDVEKAAALFQAAAAEAPHSPLLKRRQCQALTLLGRHREAVKACGESLYEQQASGLGLRAIVGALMSGPEPPTLTELGYAIVHASRARQVLSNEPAGYAGQCDIAEKLGDVEMLKACIRDLERVAPGHYETERARTFVAAIRPGVAVAAAWLALVLLGLATAFHAFFLRRRPKAVIVAALVMAALPALPATVHAAEPVPAPQGSTVAPTAERPVPGHLSKHPINDADPESSVPTPAERDADPVEFGYFIMDLGDRAESSVSKGDHKQAVKYYRALAKAVPDAAVGFVKTCDEYELAGDLDSARNYCAAALTLKGVTLADYSHYARLALQKKSLTPAELTNLDAVVKHLKEHATSWSVGLDIECTLGAHEGDRARLEDCVPALAATAPDSPKTLFYQWALAIQKKDFASAERIVARAKTGSTPIAQIAEMDRVTIAAMPAWRKGLHAFGDWRFGALVSVLLALGLCLLLLKRRNIPTSPSSV